uniref:Uncharacterized protein n=1 Tax=Timema cristinae TaxID=61476 RepID=A0A7R9CWG5_TIMCR|nr:unnamed protein product [Timema cristinae]
MNAFQYGRSTKRDTPPTFQYASYIDRIIRVINRYISVEAENRLDLPDLEQDFTLSDGSSYQVTFTDRHAQGFSVLIREGEVTEDINGESGQAITITSTFRLPGVPLIYSFSALATNGSTVSGEIEIEVEELLLEAVVFLDKESDTSYQASAGSVTVTDNGRSLHEHRTRIPGLKWQCLKWYLMNSTS